MNITIPQALFIGCLTHIALAIALSRYWTRFFTREIAKMADRRITELKLTRQQFYARGLSEGVKRGLNVSLSHRTESQN